MKTMKAFCTAIVLSLTITLSAFAGEIATPGAAQTGETSTDTFSTSPLVQPTEIKLDDLNVSTISDALLTLVSMF